MPRILGPAVAVIAATAGCAATVDVAEARAALEQADARYSEAATRIDVDAWVSTNTGDAKMHPPGLATIRGIDAIRDFGTDGAWKVIDTWNSDQPASPHPPQ